jgi:hypothetical protein
VETKGKTALPTDFGITAEMRGWARFNAPGVDVDAATAEFIDYCRARDWRMKDWTATWRNWIRKATKASAGRSYAAAPAKPVAAVQVPLPTQYPQADGYKAALNLALLRMVMATPCTVDQLRAAVRVRNRIAGEMRTMWGEKPPAEEWRDLSPGYLAMLRASLSTATPATAQSAAA